jgi:hypothetical protein
MVPDGTIVVATGLQSVGFMNACMIHCIEGSRRSMPMRTLNARGTFQETCLHARNNEPPYKYLFGVAFDVSIFS